jgi:hypothetical protein
MKLTLVTVGLLFMATTASAKLNCENVAGQWSGKMEGAFNGATSMSIGKNCKVKWLLPDGRTNNCKYKSKGGNIEYSCSLGSRGTVAFKAGGIAMENTYTAAKHGAYIVNVSRAK